MKNKNLFNKKGLKSFRSALRNSSTSAEVALWLMLKSKKLEGRKFRRQYSIGNYIVDFCCPSERLIIELDGNPHGEYDRIINHPGRKLRYALLFALRCGHPSLKSRGNFYLSLTLHSFAWVDGYVLTAVSKVQSQRDNDQSLLFDRE